MSRSIVVRCVALAGIATFACWSGKPPPRDTPIENRKPLAMTDNAATTQTPYWCSISDGGFDYPQMPCAIRVVNGRRLLAKLAGSQRFRGYLTRRGDAYLFSGEFYCPWGDCQKPLRGRFEPIGNGALRGTFEDDAMVVTLVPAAADSPWGGATYGGDGYGGFGYGGFGYGATRRRR
jgi:hypothetical protein